MLIITNPVEHTKQYLPSELIKNQVQDNSQKRLAILNSNIFYLEKLVMNRD
jgi:hypothetical protein